jgi:uncharacterized protein
MSDDNVSLRHEPERRRFVAETAGGNGVLEYAVVDAGTLDYRHTFVPEPLRGRGIASRLVKFALDYARAEGRTVIATCPFVAAMMQREPQYQSLRAEKRAASVRTR